MNTLPVPASSAAHVQGDRAKMRYEHAAIVVCPGLRVFPDSKVRLIKGRPRPLAHWQAMAQLAYELPVNRSLS
jgi:hypothetical protein